MAMQPLEQRLDELNQKQSDLNQRIDLSATLPESQVEVPDFEAMTPKMEEGVQVAGVFGTIRDIIKGTTKEVEKIDVPVVPKLTEEAQKAADLQDIKKAAEAGGITDQQRAGIAAKIEQGKLPEMTPEAFMQERAAVKPEELLAKPPKGFVNLPLMETMDDVKRTVIATGKLNRMDYKKLSLKELEARRVKRAEEAGLGPKFIEQLIAGKLPVSPEYVDDVMQAMVASATHLDGLARQVASGTASPEVIAEMAQTIHFHSVLQQSAKNYQTNIAQSLRAMALPRDGMINIQSILSDFGDVNDITKFAQAFIDLQDPIARAKLISGKAQGTVWDKLFTSYVNGLLYRPTTHIKNALSNTVFIPWRLTERAIASGIGNIRRAVGFGSDDIYQFSEIPAIITSTPTAIRNGFQLAVRAANTGVPFRMTDPTKIAHMQSRTQLFNHRDDKSLASTALRSINFVATLPGRSLLTADEFFKGINYTHELSAEATRLGVKTFDDAIKQVNKKTGKPKFTIAEAQAQADDAVSKFLAEPPDYIATMSETGTFTQKLEGTIGPALQRINPGTPAGFALRTQMPFINTPVNIMSEVVSRTPLGIFSKDIRATLKSGWTKEADMALAKVGMGSSAVYMMGDLATNGHLTGSGPGEKGSREAMIRQGWQPYSMVFDVSDIDDSIRMALSKLPTTVTYGSGDYSGKIYVSYQGMEPVGAMLAMASDYIDYVKYEGDDSRVNAVFGGLAFGFGNYMLDSPFLQGINNLNQIFFGGGSTNNKQAFVSKINMLAKTFAEVGHKALNPLSGAVTSIKEKIDPTIRDYQADPNLPAGLKGLLDAVNKMRSDTPGLSLSLPPKLNIWGEPVEYEYAYAPWRIKKGKMREVDQGLIQLDANIGMPSRTFKKEDPFTKQSVQVKLTTEEYNEMLRIANQELDLENRVLSVLDSIEQNNGAKSIEEYQTAISKPFKDTFDKAREILFNDSIFSVDIQDRVSKQAMRVQELNIGKRAK